MDIRDIFGGKNPFDESVWKTGDKWAAIAMALLLIGGGGITFLWYLPTILSFIIWAAANTILAIVLFVVLAGLVALLSDGKFRTSLRYKFRGLAHMLTRIFVRSDPIGAMRGYLSDLEGQIGELSGQRRMVGQRIVNLGHTIREWVGKIEEASTGFKQAQQKNDKGKQFIHSNQANRLEQSLQRLIKLWVGLKRLSLFLEHAEDRAHVIHDDCKNEIEVVEVELEQVQAASSAAASAFRVLRGNPDQRALYDMALTMVAERVGANVADMRHFMSVSQEMLNAADANNMAGAERGAKLLEEWEAKGASFVLEAQFTKIKDADFAEDLAALGVELPSGEKQSGGKSAYRQLFANNS